MIVFSKKTNLKRVKKKMTIKIVRLMTGEDIICNYEETEDGFRVLKNPCMMVPSPNGIGAATWLPYSKEAQVNGSGVKLNPDYVAFTADPTDEVLNQYSTTFGNGIVIPQTAPPPDLRLSTMGKKDDMPLAGPQGTM